MVALPAWWGERIVVKRVLWASLLMAMTAAAHAGEWRIVTVVNPISITFVDIGDMEKAADGTLKIWSQNIDSGLNVYKYHMYFRCAANQMGLQASLGVDGTGKVRDTVNHDEKDIEFKPVEPNSTVERAEAMVCADNPRAYGVSHNFPGIDGEPLPFMTEVMRLEKEKQTAAGTAASGSSPKK